MKLRIVSVVMVSVLLACSPSPQETENDIEKTVNVPDPVMTPELETQTSELNSWISADFSVPTLVESEAFKLIPLGPEVGQVDFDAYMSSIEHLQTTFSRSTNWPHENISDEDVALDMEAEQKRFQNRESFAYAVLTPDGARERGCIYVYPSTVPGYDAVVRLWVTKAEYDDGFDEVLYAWTQDWVGESWPFARVAFPGRDVEWEAWDSIVEATGTGMLEKNVQTALGFIDAFYTFDPVLLKPFVAQAEETGPRILYYQGWAKGGNYKVLNRIPCAPESPSTISCPVTVQDDPVLALKTGFNVTDTFHITFEDGVIVSIHTSSNDQPIYHEAREWVKENMPEVMSGPCANRGTPEGTPAD